MSRPGEWTPRSLAIATGQPTAPGPDADIISVAFDPCPPDVGELPPAIAEATAAALDVANTATTLVGIVQSMTRGWFRAKPSDGICIFGLFWWSTVAKIRPARERVHAAGGYLNRDRKPVRMLGATGPSAHHAAIDYAATHAARMFRLAAIHQKQTDRLIDDPAELCRVSQPANQAMQDTLLAGLPMVFQWYRTNPQPHVSDDLVAAILAEARDAAALYEQEYRQLEGDRRPQGPYASGCFRWGDGAGLVNIPPDQWRLLSALFTGPTPRDPVPDQELIARVYDLKVEDDDQPFETAFKSLYVRLRATLLDGNQGHLNRPRSAGTLQYVPPPTAC